MGVHPNGDKVHAVGPEGTAANQAERTQGQAAPETVDREGLGCVRRAARVEAAGGDPAGSRSLVGGDQGHRDAYGHAPPGLGAAHAGTLSRAAFRSAAATSSRNIAGASVAAPGSSRTR